MSGPANSVVRHCPVLQFQSTRPALIDNWHGSGSYSQSPGLLQWRVCRSAIGLFNRLQSVLRPSARLVLGLPGRAPVMSAIRDMLHWLSYPQRVTFKLCLTTYKCLHGLAPPYLTRFCTPLSAVAGPSWNSLPAAIRLCENILIFKRHLKTHLFKLT